jgi:hypothetical protein
MSKETKIEFIDKVINPEGITLLIRNNQPLSCPFQPSTAIGGKLQGQISFIKQPCSSNCPFFDDYPEVNRITLRCKDVTLFYRDKEEKEEQSRIKLL